MTKRVARLLQQELSEQAFLMESQGQSMLPEGFGEGGFCVCDNVCLPHHHHTCGACMLSRDHVVHLHPGVDERGKEGVGTLVSNLRRDPDRYPRWQPWHR